MARKQRDYKAEYARAKARATRAGYKSERQYKAVRKTLQLPRNAPVIPAWVAAPDVTATATATGGIGRLRRESREWSQKHSKVANSRYRASMTDEQVERYHRAFVVKPVGKTRYERNRNKYEAIEAYLVPDLLDEKEWESKYPWK